MESAAQSVVGNVVRLLGEEYQLLSGVGGEVAELRDDLDTMNALLRMQSEADDGAVDHFVGVWMKQLRELAYDSEDSIDLYRLRIKSRPNDSFRAWLGRLLGTLSPRRRLACEIRALRARATTISERHARYGVNRDALRPSPGPSLLPVTSSSLGAAPAKNADRNRFVGIEDQATTLAKRLKETRGDETGTGEPKAVFSVVGFGGLGKTTLAMEVCRMVEADFPFQAMVAVSQTFEPTRDLKPLLERVLQQVLNCTTDNENQHGGLDGDIDRLDDVGRLARKLEQGLEDKRYLIVIDDVWTVRAWEAIQSILPENKCGSRVLVTTRIENVAKACCPASVGGEYIYRIQPLSQENSTKLFLSRVFGSTDAKCPDGLKEEMESILRKCDGLPLAIVSIASVLAGYTSSESKEKWETVRRSMGSQMEMHPTLEGMSQILKLSYNHMPHELKSCMMYLSIFPEDYMISKDRLLHKWIAEGLVPEKRGMTMLEVAESYFNELLSRNMIFSVQGERSSPFDYDGNMECCKVHDMLLEVMVSKSLEYNFVSLLGGQYNGMSYNRIRRLSIHEGMDNRTNMHICGGQGDSPRNKRTTASLGSNKGMKDLQQHVRSLSMFQLHGNKLLLDQLGSFTLLRVLDLEDCMGIEYKHVRYACQLHLLKFLSFKGTDIKEVPPQIKNLEYLQTLDLRDTFLAKGLPTTVTKLEKLERLHISTVARPFCVQCRWRLPEGLSSMKALREVAFSALDNVEVARELGKLQELQELSIYIVEAWQIRDHNTEGNKAFHREIANSLSKLHSLRSLEIASDTDALECLHRLREPPRLLRHLHIRGAIGSHQLPSWVGSLTNLVEIVLTDVWDLRDDEPFGVLCKLPSLQSIRMEWRCYSGKELVARSSHNFPALVNLTMAFWGDTLQAFRFEAGSMPKLEKLRLLFLDSKTHVVTGIEHLTRLKEVLLLGAKTNIVEQFKAESACRREKAGSSQFQIIVVEDEHQLFLQKIKKSLGFSAGLSAIQNSVFLSQQIRQQYFQPSANMFFSPSEQGVGRGLPY